MPRLMIKKKDVVAFIICFTFIPVDAFELIIGNIGYAVLLLITCIFVSIVSFKDKVFLKSRQFMIWLLLLIWMTLCTLINRQTPLYPLVYVGRVTFWFLINDWYIKNGSLRLLKVSRKYVGIVIFITFLQQMLAPGIFGYTESMNSRTFFVSDNYLGYFYIAYIALCFILDYVEHNNTQPKTYFMTGLCFASILRAWSVKSVIGIGIIILYILFVYRRKLSRLLGPRVVAVLFVLIFVSVVFLNVQANFIWFFNKYFGKNITVLVRHYVWMQALQNIKAHPFFGYGIRAGQRLLLHTTWAGNARSSHNIILELILEGGFIGLGIYLISIISAVVNKKESIQGKNKYEYLFLLFIVFSFFVMQLASGSIYYPFFYMPIILIDNLDKIVEIKEKQKQYDG